MSFRRKPESSYFPDVLDPGFSPHRVTGYLPVYEVIQYFSLRPIKVTKAETSCQGPKGTCLPSLLTFVFEAKAWTGRGGRGAICESTGRDLGLHQRNQKSFRKERRKACGLRLVLWKDHRLVVSRSATLPPRPGGGLKLLEPLISFEECREGKPKGNCEGGGLLVYFFSPC